MKTLSGCRAWGIGSWRGGDLSPLSLLRNQDQKDERPKRPCQDVAHRA